MHSQRRRRRSVPAVVATALVAGLLATPLTVSEAATGSPAVRCKDASAFLATIGGQDFCLRAFTTAGEFTWTVPEGIDSFQVLAVGGGGGGGGGAVGGVPFQSGRTNAGGGGGGGGAFYVRDTKEVDGREGTAREISGTVGAGGAGGAGALNASSGGSDGTAGGFTTVKWADDTSITNVAGAEGGKGGTTSAVDIDPGTENPGNTPETKGGAGGSDRTLAAGGGGGRFVSDGRTGGAGETTAFQGFWPAGPGSRTISGGGGGGATCTDNSVVVAQGGGSGGAGAASRAFDDGFGDGPVFSTAGKGTFGGGGGGGSGSGGGACSGASTAGADGGDGAVFFRYAAFRTDVTSNPFDIVIFVAAQDADPRTISIAGFDQLGGGSPTFTVDREGKFEFDIPTDDFTTTPVSGDLSDPVDITQARDGGGNFALSLFWTNPAGQDDARIQAERIEVQQEGDDLDPFALFITSKQFGFDEAAPFTGETAGPRTVTTGLVAGADNPCARFDPDAYDGESCRLQARLQFAPGKDLGDIGAPERNIRARFVFTILDE